MGTEPALLAEEADRWMPADPQSGHGERYALQRRKGYPFLRFFPDLEADFRASFVGINKTRIRVAGSIGMLGVFGFVFLDQVLGMNLEPLHADLLLILVTIPALAVPLAATFREKADPHQLLYIMIASLALEFSILAVINIGRSSNAWFPYESLFLVTMYVYFVSGLLFYQAILCCLSLWLGFTVSNWTLQDHAILLYESYYLLIANVIGCLGTYMLEIQARHAYLLGRELSVHALQDSLTGMLNRRAFRRHLDTAWRQAQREKVPVGIMVVDLDGFKRINDTGGHPFGDHALQQVAQAIKDSTHRPLDAVGRYGGDEFIGLWYGVDPAWFERLAEEMPSKLVNLACGDPRNPLRVTISGGAVVVWPRPGISPDDAIRLADEKLYQMKRGARGAISCERISPPEGAVGLA